MILLIIGVGMLNFLLPAPLNSIMFLLIPKSNSMLRSQYSSFKFHYVSINSRTHISCKRSFFNFKFHYVSINSQQIARSHDLPAFKFHYVSIIPHVH